MRAAPKTVRKVHFVSLGCAKNRVDTEALLGQLLRTGFKVTSDPLAADTVVVNTCGFLQSAVDEALEEISVLASMKKMKPFTLAVTGCLVQRMGKELKSRIPQIDLLIGIHGYNDIVKNIGKKRSNVPAGPCNYSSQHYLNRALTTGPGWAYLRIADGCDNRCSYCLIPRIRGPFRSRPMEHIMAEAKVLVNRGVREIILIAQDTTHYGTDIYKRRALPELLRKLAKIRDLRWIRILYTHPAHYSNELIETIADSDKIVKYLDIPLQHIDERILRAMHRKIGADALVNLLERLRSNIPGLMLRTTFMVGFPGEKGKSYGRLLSFIENQRFDRMGAFVYSPEPGTKAAGLAGQVRKGTAQKRLVGLMKEQKRISYKLNTSRIGCTCHVMIEGETGDGSGVPHRSGYQYYGRSWAEAPEVDGKIFVQSVQKLVPGSFINVRINKAWDYDLGGVHIQQRTDLC